MLKAFNAYIAENDLFKKDETILLAVSGGMDSMVMTNLFQRSGFNIALAHCNFELRSKDADADEKFVKEFAKTHNLSFHSKAFNTKEYANKNGLSIQMAARELRYDWFEEIRVKNSYQYIATAHHADDAAETFFINLSRGTGLKGLIGIKSKRDRIIRPLLFAERQEIQSYCRKQKLEYREDKSNQDTNYHRNRIRINILPELEKINPAYRKNIAETMRRIESLQNHLSAAVHTFKEDYVLHKNDQMMVSLTGLKKVSNKDAILFELLEPFNVPSAMISDILTVTKKTSGRSFKTKTHQLIIDRGQLLIRPINLKEKSEIFISEKTDKIKKPISLSFSLTDGSTKLLKDSSFAFLDRDLLIYPLILRPWKHGDRFYPLGMGQSKKLSDFFTDLKLSLFEKESVWVLSSKNDIVWIVGHRIDHRYRVTKKTKRVLKIEFKQVEG